MPRNTSVSLGAQFASFIDIQVSEGRYGSASSVVRAGLDRQAKKLGITRQALIKMWIAERLE